MGQSDAKNKTRSRPWRTRTRRGDRNVSYLDEIELDTTHRIQSTDSRECHVQKNHGKLQDSLDNLSSVLPHDDIEHMSYYHLLEWLDQRFDKKNVQKNRHARSRCNLCHTRIAHHMFSWVTDT